MNKLKQIFNKLFSNTDKISFMESFNLTNMAIVTFTQGDTKVNFILDSGSTVCLIDKKILEKLKYKETDDKNNLYGIEGEPTETPIHSIEFFYKGTAYTYNYLVKDLSKAFKIIKEETGVTVHGILGTDFFNKFKYVLDFDDLVAYSKV